MCPNPVSCIRKQTPRGQVTPQGHTAIGGRVGVRRQLANWSPPGHDVACGEPSLRDGVSDPRGLGELLSAGRGSGRTQDHEEHSCCSQLLRPTSAAVERCREPATETQRREGALDPSRCQGPEQSHVLSEMPSLNHTVLSNSPSD